MKNGFSLLLIALLSGLSTGMLFAEPAPVAEKPAAFAFIQKPDRVEISFGGKPVGDYIFKDPNVRHPFFANMRAPDGIQVTRNYPPVNAADMDHAELNIHTGIWLAFADINGQDFWRDKKASVQHQKFLAQPAVRNGIGSFTVLNHYLAEDSRFICREKCRYTLLARPNGYLLTWDSTFDSPDSDFTFGDGKNMGLGVRVAAQIVAQSGNGVILNSHNQKNEKETWGKTADWCDYSGVINGEHVGILVVPDPANFRPSWFHTRDYGLFVANNFGQNALAQGAKAPVTVRQGESFHLRFAILLHGTPEAASLDLPALYQDCRAEMAKARARLQPPLRPKS